MLNGTQHVTLGKKIAKIPIFYGFHGFRVSTFGLGFDLCLNPEFPGQDGSNDTSNSPNGLKTTKISRGTNIQWSLSVRL